MSHQHVNDWIREASEEHGVPEKIIKAVIQQESGYQGDVVSPAGAIGYMQLMPGTAEGLGVNPRDHRDNIRGGTKYLKQQMDAFGGDLTLALAAYNAGPQAVKDHGGIPPYEETQHYVTRILGFMNGGGSYDLDAFATDPQSFSAYENPNPGVDIKDPVKVGAGTKFADSFQDGVYDTSIAGVTRTLWSGIGTGSTVHIKEEGKPRFTQDDFEWVQGELPDDPIAQQFVLLNSRNSTHLSRMVAMKKDDIARRERISGYMENGKSSLFGFRYDPATIAGQLASTVADPLTYLPLAQEAKAVQMFSRLGKFGHMVSMSKVLKYSELAATNALLNVGERKLAEKFAGNEQDYQVAAMIGGAAGAGLGAIGDMYRYTKSKGLHKVYGALNGTEDAAIRMSGDLDHVNLMSKQHTREALQEVSSTKLHLDGVQNPHMKQILNDEGAFIIRKADIPTVAKKLGIDIADNAEAFYHNGHAVVIPENLRPGSSIEGALRHEIVAHGELRNTIGEEQFDKLMGTVQKYMNGDVKVPRGSNWEKAIKTAPEGSDAEEILGYFLQFSSGKDNVFKGIKKGINETMRKFGSDVDFSDAEIKAFADKSLKNAAERKGAIRELPDGSTMQGGVRYSNGNAFGKHTLEHAFDLTADVLARTQGAFPKWIRKYTQRAEAGWFFGNDRGIVANSNSKTAGDITKLLVNDERHRSTEVVQSVESMKNYLQGHLNTMWGQYVDLRSQAVLGATGYKADLKAIPHLWSLNDKYRAFNKEVREAYNQIHAGHGLKKEFKPEVIQAANQLKQLRDEIIDIGKRSAEMFGVKTKNMVEKDWEVIDQELWRVLDDEQWSPFVNRFRSSGLEVKPDANGKWPEPDPTTAVGFLTQYARRAVKTDIVRERLLRAKTKDYEVKLKAWEDTVEGLAEGATKPPRPSKPKVKDKEVDEWIHEESRNWAYGIVDQDNSSLRHAKKDWEENSVSFLRERFPMDTSIELEIPNSKGTKFSFDKNLRSDDLDSIIPRVIDRFTGEAAFRNHFPTDEAWRAAKDKMTQEHGHAVSHRAMSADQVKKVEKALENMESTLRGTYNKEVDPTNTWNLFGNILRTWTYSNNGGNMGFMQIGEVAGSIGYAGGRAIPHILPGLGDFMSKALHGKEMTNAIKDAEGFLFGEVMDRKLFRTGFQSKAANEVATLNDEAMRKVGNTAGTVANAASRLTSTVNLLPYITDSMVRGVRKVFIGDSIRWAQGEVFGKARHGFIDPFSETKMKAAGISQEMGGRVKADILKYTKMNADGKPVDMEMMKWRDESPDTFFAYRNWLDQGSRRAITQSSVGNRNYLKDSNIFYKTIFQFKDFTLKGVNGQLLRAMTTRDIEDAYTTVLSMGTNMGAYYALSYGKAWAKYPNDEQKRNAYIEKTTSWEKLGTAAIVRSVMLGSIGSFVNDAYEMATGAETTFRTTVDRTNKFNQGKERDGGDIIGDLVTQTPSWRTGAAMTYTPLNMAYKAYRDDAHVTEYDVRDLTKAVPLQNWLPMVLLQSLLLEEADIPKKDLKKPK